MERHHLLKLLKLHQLHPDPLLYVAEGSAAVVNELHLLDQEAPTKSFTSIVKVTASPEFVEDLQALIFCYFQHLTLLKSKNIWKLIATNQHRQNLPRFSTRTWWVQERSFDANRIVFSKLTF